MKNKVVILSALLSITTVYATNQPTVENVNFAFYFPVLTLGILGFISARFIKQNKEEKLKDET